MHQLGSTHFFKEYGLVCFVANYCQIKKGNYLYKKEGKKKFIENHTIDHNV
jgi:hypothetical protein